MQKLPRLGDAKRYVEVKATLFAHEYAIELLEDLRKIAKTFNLEESRKILLELFEAWREAFDSKIVDMFYITLCPPPLLTFDEPVFPEPKKLDDNP